MLAPDTPIDKFLLRLQELAENLATLYEQLAFTRRTELELKVQAYQSSPSESIAGRTRDSEMQASHTTTSVWEIEAQIEVMKEEKFYILTCMKWSGEDR